MSASSAALADRRRAAASRAAAKRRHPASRQVSVSPAAPPPTAYYVIAVVVAAFVMLGLVMVLSASSIQQFHRGQSPWRIFNRQAMWAGLGLLALLTCARLPYRAWRRLVLPLMVLAFVAMLMPLIPGLGAEVNDAQAWVAIGPFSFQPSEFLKLAVLVYCADLLTRRGDEMGDLGRTLVPTIWVALAGSALCLLQGDLGSAIVLAGIVLGVAFVGGVPLTPMFATVIGGASLAMLFVLSSTRRFNRFTSFLDITGNRDYLAYQQYQAMIGIAQGGATGAGPGRGLNKLGDFLPLAHSDFIFAVIAEELGLIGVVAVLGGFLVLTFCGVQVALAARDRFGALVAGGIAAWFVLQTLINVGGVTGVLPVTGLTLPFFSAGGTSLFVSMAAAGMLLNVARHAR